MGALICRPQVDFHLGTRDRLLADERLPLLPPFLLQARTTSHVRFGSSSSYSSHQARLALDYLPFVGLISYIFHCYICTKICLHAQLLLCTPPHTFTATYTHIHLTPIFRMDILFRISCFISSSVLAFAQIADTTFCNSFRGGWNVVIFKTVFFFVVSMCCDFRIVELYGVCCSV